MLRFVTSSRSENEYGFERSGLKTGVENDIFGSEIMGQDFENGAAHPHQEFPGVPPPPPRANESW